MDDLLADFATEAREALAAARAALALGEAGRVTAARRLHGLKGSAACLRLSACEAAAHEAETHLAEGRDIEALLDRLAALAGEAAIIAPASASPSTATATATAADAFAGLEAMTRDLGLRLGKRIELMTWGADLPLPAEAVQPLRQALIALLRNACDHGIETAAERAAKNKPAMAVLRLSARMRGTETVIEVADDGRGFDASVLLRQAQAQGRPLAFQDSGEGPGLGALDAQKLMFEAGFTTALSVTPVSGRGLGLDLVRDACERLGGRVETASTAGRGAVFTLVLPEAAPARRPNRAMSGGGAA